MIAVRRPILIAAATAVVASGWLLWQSLSGGPTVAPVPPAGAPGDPAVDLAGTGIVSRPAATDSASVPRLAEVSRAAGVGPRLAGDSARGGGVRAPAPAARGLFPLGAGEEPAPDPVVAAREDCLRARVESLRQAFPGVRMRSPTAAPTTAKAAWPGWNRPARRRSTASPKPPASHRDWPRPGARAPDRDERRRLARRPRTRGSTETP